MNFFILNEYACSYWPTSEQWVSSKNIFLHENNDFGTGNKFLVCSMFRDTAEAVNLFLLWGDYEKYLRNKFFNTTAIKNTLRYDELFNLIVD